ncbi:MAG: hypothetical protein COU46_00925 [Candidatus Niyogibacteria bacterium CG10_big_fil_rev_8_21_14_0_10_42_19]|uniref:Uncharacterized protein n=1 Tax=Candidatus Niyogibacteria bacterium CG10_big_fil_rev_8_21_14_0_10_42_19 TaxID=1974725 RepID=A0A2H0THW2_9BACT|nr:MAG: hypothetical protein COU46_00925 [Candidatus Niyogibacteria bacterium CG10_big_fil_rev_8_21_14_0_10_42_19]
MTILQLRSYIWQEILEPLIGLILIVATVVFIWGIIEFISNSDSEEARAKGKKHIIYGVVGLFIMMSVWGIVQLLCTFWDTCGEINSL